MSTSTANGKASQPGPGFTAILKAEGTTFRSVLTFTSESEAEQYGRNYSLIPAFKAEFVGTEPVEA